jgi:hypothetical protein
MYGLWTADDDFCVDSGISSMLLFIGPPIRGWSSMITGSTERAGYIIICDDITNQSLSIDYRTGYGGISVGKYTVSAKFKFDIEDIFMNDGANVKLEFDIVHGKLRIYDPVDGKVYARMYKQNDISNLLAFDSDALEAADGADVAADSTNLAQNDADVPPSAGKEDPLGDKL